MLNADGLSALLDLKLNKNAATLRIYAACVTARLQYTCSFIFNHVLGVHFLIVTDTSQPVHISYHAKPAGGIHIVPDGLLSEKAVRDFRPEGFVKAGDLYFFESEIGYHFDLFAAVFYFISRMEEWGSFKKDKHGRFEAQASILKEYQYLLIPVVDRWIDEFKRALRSQFPEIICKPAQPVLISTMDVDNLFAYRKKGLIRVGGAYLKDLIRRDFSQMLARTRVLFFGKKDPFDIYEEIGDFCFEHKIPLFCFFLFRTGNRFDRTVPPGSSGFREVAEKLMRSYAHCGIHPSYYSMEKPSLLERELHFAGKAFGTGVTLSRQHYLRMDIQRTPAELIKHGIVADFTMGFASRAGFRAGTAYPFHYFDFHQNQETNLLMVPFCAMDGAFCEYSDGGPEEMEKTLDKIAAELRKTGGVFATVFHERSFYDHLYSGFGSLYKRLHARFDKRSLS